MTELATSTDGQASALNPLLDQGEFEGTVSTSPFSLDKLGSTIDAGLEGLSLAELRDVVDQCDAALVRVISWRNRAVDQISDVKVTQKANIYDGGREREVLNQMQTHAEELGVEPDMVRTLGNVILDASRLRQAVRRRGLGELAAQRSQQ